MQQNDFAGKADLQREKSLQREENLQSSKDLYSTLNEKAEIMYRFVMLYSDYMKMPRDYGTGEQISMTEVHTLTLVADQPGITVTEISQSFQRTKGAASQIVGKLEEKKLLYKQKEDGNGKNLHCYVTERGRLLAEAHKRFDCEGLERENALLAKRFNDKELESFYNILKYYTEKILIPDLKQER